MRPSLRGISLSAAIVGVAVVASAACSPDAGSSGAKIAGTGGASGTGSASGTGGTASAGAGGEGTGGSTFVLPDASSGGGPACDACADAGPVCGDGILDPSEKCDDGNVESADGCVATCDAVENDYACPNPGEKCLYLVTCGDGVVGGSETCDDHGTTPGDGCDGECHVEPGWACLVPGARCVAARCGDGIVAGNERCDDGNTDTPPEGGTFVPDGCNAECHRDPAYACPSTGGACHMTFCGDGVLEGSEQCDDGNRGPFDGCSPTCTAETQCKEGSCTALCGDGLKFPQEECDDGNTIAGDGCSATCTFEPGYTCEVVTQAPPDQLRIPILYRDFLYKNTTIPGPGHADFESYGGNGAKGMVGATLGADGKPTYLASMGFLTSPELFYWWYHENDCSSGTCVANPYESVVYLDAAGNPTTLTLASLGGGTYQYSNSAFFPIDGLGWNATGTPQVSSGHNFSFTSELRYVFTYQGGEKLDFTGDDDVWVFINGRLAVDLGGLHPPQNGSITLDATAAATLGLTPGGMYEMTLFQAERHTDGSNYRLTLSGFVKSLTQCKSVCGDGIVTPDEVCDATVNDGSYGGCMPGCQARGPYCGDSIQQPAHEACDDGVNLSPYGGCAPGCVTGGKCGDGKVDSRFGEQCDDGTNAGGYGGCEANCKLGPRCGDGQKQSQFGEECDDGNTDSLDSCSTTCKLRVPQ